MQPVVILTTGGTLDKVHDTLSESLAFAPDVQTALPILLTAGRCDYPRIETIMQKDSLDMVDADRDAILSAVRGAPERHVVITHGTGTMEQTAQFLDGKTGDKTVVLTGAMRPFELGRSDASFNVGGALIGAQSLPAGVYAIMNGRIFTAQNVHKNVQKGRFDL